ncbi:MAG: nicotinate-nucleotide adenylyltransferase [Rhodospirillales bacterium]|nr:nicotinate-nucleotide adenylyltransferase [Rhodospirillales bacterium]
MWCVARARPVPDLPGALPKYGHRFRLKIGLLGGSFNPAHEGHLHVAQQAIRHLGLDQLWLMVSPGNPLKPAAGMGAPAARLASARRIADGRRIIATDIETQLGTRFTRDTMRVLKRRFPCVHFVWLMGADNLIQLPRWGRWLEIMHAMPMLVVPRPGATRQALAGRAAKRHHKYRLPARAGLCLAGKAAPAWILLPVRENAASATELRRRILEGTRP